MTSTESPSPIYLIFHPKQFHRTLAERFPMTKLSRSPEYYPNNPPRTSQTILSKCQLSVRDDGLLVSQRSCSVYVCD